MNISNAAVIQLYAAGPESMPVPIAPATLPDIDDRARFAPTIGAHGPVREDAEVLLRDKLAWFVGLYALSVVSFGALVGGVRWTLASF